jgi:hypothetical protein
MSYDKKVIKFTVSKRAGRLLGAFALILVIGCFVGIGLTIYHSVTELPLDEYDVSLAPLKSTTLTINVANDQAVKINIDTDQGVDGIFLAQAEYNDLIGGNAYYWEEQIYGPEDSVVSDELNAGQYVLYLRNPSKTATVTGHVYMGVFVDQYNRMMPYGLFTIVWTFGGMIVLLFAALFADIVHRKHN